MIRKKNGFTLVELLAVIVILAIILVIAVPQIMKTIDNAREGAFSSSAKLIAASAEREYLVRETLGDTNFDPDNVEMECSEVAETTSDYSDCDITFTNGKAYVTLVGDGKFEGKYVCAGTRESATVTKTACSGEAGGNGSDEQGTPAVYDVENNVLKTWEELLAEGSVTVDGTTLTKISPSITGEKLVIPGTITSVAERAIDGWSNPYEVNNIVFSEGLIEIKYEAIYDNFSNDFPKIYLPNSLTTVEQRGIYMVNSGIYYNNTEYGLSNKDEFNSIFDAGGEGALQYT